MKKNIIVVVSSMAIALIATLAVLHFSPRCNIKNYYATSATVVEIDGDLVTVSDGYNLWQFEGTFGCDPFTVGDAVDMVMYNNGTWDMREHEIVNVCYDHSTSLPVAVETRCY